MLIDWVWLGRMGKYLALFYHSWCNWTWKMKSVILFLMENVKLISVDSLKSLIYITRLITVKPWFLSLNGNLSLRDNRLIVVVNNSFSSGCDLYWLYFDLARHSFLTSDGFSVQKWYILLCLTGKSGLSVHPLWKDWISLTRSMTSRVQLKLLSLNSKLSVREN